MLEWINRGARAIGRELHFLFAGSGYVLVVLPFLLVIKLFDAMAACSRRAREYAATKRDSGFLEQLAHTVSAVLVSTVVILCQWVAGAITIVSLIPCVLMFRLTRTFGVRFKAPKRES